MKRINIPFGRSFQLKVTLLLVLSLFFIATLSNYLIYKFSYDSQFNQLRSKLKIIAQTAALFIDADVLQQVPLNKEGINSQAYKTIAEKLMSIKRVNPPIKYIYTMVKTDKEGVWQFVVDPEPLVSGITSYPGDKFNATQYSEISKAFFGPAADKKLEVDKWGIFLSGYAPIRDKTGKAVAMMGVDVAADDVYAFQKGVKQRGVLVLVLGIVISLFLGMMISKKITNPINELVEGTYHIGEGDLRYRVRVRTKDEIGELGRSFNQMADSLFEVRKKLLDYFYRIAQSLVRILEAKDQYTRGHSERVADLSEKIAAKLGIPKDKIDLLKEAALLHDVGKIGIKESILNKEGKLTTEEWDDIQKHPIIGEDIIKPVSISEEMLAIVRGHHERYDGAGYPDKINGENINIFTAIVSVADAYDAMTSPRAYRPALSKKDSVGQLQINRGSQFHPEVVDALIEILKTEI
ncbi:MAG: HD domain-containing protein [Candidatus Omnitrophica bacterium]|nr:HD domain-containing protein [Candidatus Omnitrophota bacterium]